LFVCTGNICRSPTAHGVFLHMARAAGLAVLAKRRGAGAPTHPLFWAAFIAAGDWR